MWNHQICSSWVNNFLIIYATLPWKWTKNIPEHLITSWTYKQRTHHFVLMNNIYLSTIGHLFVGQYVNSGLKVTTSDVKCINCQETWKNIASILRYIRQTLSVYFFRRTAEFQKETKHEGKSLYRYVYVVVTDFVLLVINFYV